MYTTIQKHQNNLKQALYKTRINLITYTNFQLSMCIQLFRSIEITQKQALYNTQFIPHPNFHRLIQTSVETLN